MFDGKYLEWNHKRIKTIIDNYGYQFFHGKKILDLGAGHGDVGGALYRLGAEVTCIDARAEHLKIATKKFPGIKTQQMDLDIKWPTIKCDIILDLDLLNHIKDFKRHLQSVCNLGNIVILETAVCDSDDVNIIKTGNENKSIYDWSFNGVTSYPTAAAIEKVLLDCGMSFRRIDDSKLNSSMMTYDWKISNNRECNPNKRRLWFCEKQVKTETAVEVKPSNLNPSLPKIPYQFNEKLATLNTRNTPIAALPAPNTTLKIALCLSGYLRTFEENYDTFLHYIIKMTNCDIFIHTWDTLGSDLRHADSRVNKLPTQTVLSRIQSFYSPKKLVIESHKHFDISELMQRQSEGRDNRGIQSMYYKIKACNDLKLEYEKEKGFKYDIVIRCRPDLFFEGPIDLPKTIENDTVYIPYYGDFHGLNDQFALGSSKAMDKYSELIERLDQYLQEGMTMNPEKLLKYHIQKERLHVLRFSLRYCIRRSDGHRQYNDLMERWLGFVR